MVEKVMDVPGTTITGQHASEVVLRTRNLSKYYGQRIAVNNLNLEVYRGEIFGFLGPNGAGKTTTIRMALGLIAPTGGNVEILGQDVATDGAHILLFLCKPFALYPDLHSNEPRGIAAKNADELLLQSL